MLRTHDKQELDEVHTQEESQPVANEMSKETPIKHVHSSLNQETTLHLWNLNKCTPQKTTVAITHGDAARQ
jgi:hypothetical protein